MEILGVRPERRIAILFLVAIAVGTVLLSLPVSAARDSIGFIDALFTSTSAVCVTGLIVVDTGHDYSLFGQIVILALIQLGGIGVMTLASMLVLSIGARLSLHFRLGISGSLGESRTADYRVLLKAVLLTTFLSELVGAVLLYWRFRSYYPDGQAVYYSIFHSISSFCNAGFSTFSNSLESFRDDPALILIIAGLIILGGLGFVVIMELYHSLTGRKLSLSLHSKICLVTTAFLLVGGTIGFYLAEHQHLFKSSGQGLNLVNSFFQAVTCRTAGFNTVSQASLTELGILLTIILMFIGACPGSTGGGIKTTTIAVVVLMVWRRFRGFRHISLFRRTIGADSYSRALAVFILAIFIIVIMFSLFMLAEERMLAHTLSKGWFVDNLFEVVSAFGTVGLSLGITPRLHEAGKILLIVLMFVGRIGLLTLAYSLARPDRRGEIEYKEENVLVG
jgi:trk system potassium uptake protein TrkH